MTELALLALALFLSSIVAWCAWLTHHLTMVEDRQLHDTCDLIGLEKRMDRIDKRLDKVAAMPVVRE